MVLETLSTEIRSESQSEYPEKVIYAYDLALVKHLRVEKRDQKL